MASAKPIAHADRESLRDHLVRLRAAQSTLPSRDAVEFTTDNVALGATLAQLQKIIRGGEI